MHTQNSLKKCLTEDSVCPVCKNSGWEEYEKDGYIYCRECRCGIRQKQIMGSRLSFANIPESFKDMRLASFSLNAYESAEGRSKAETAVKAVSYWLEKFENMQERGMGLYLYSQAKGSGKTRMAASIANELIYGKQVQVKFATSLQILNEIKASWDKHEKGYSENRLLEYLSKTPILVIDDFGTEQAKDWTGERFYQIINSRYVDRKITIFTSNSGLDSLRYDERILNRMKERSYQIPFPEVSVRDIIAKQNMCELIKGIRKGGYSG